jgi:hypothetical protein
MLIPLILPEGGDAASASARGDDWGQHQLIAAPRRDCFPASFPRAAPNATGYAGPVV